MSVTPFDVHMNNFNRFCKEDGQLMEEEILEKKDHSARRKYLRAEILAVVDAMKKIVEQKIKAEDMTVEEITEIFTQEENANESTK